MEEVKTIYDIAREAGVSASTVSRVVNHKSGINADTRKKVEALLEKYHFIPNEAARGLVMQSSRIIGILIEDIRVVHHTESAYVIEQEMTRLGYTCITLSTGPDPRRKAECIRILEQRRVEGAILMGSMFGTPEVAQSVRERLAGIPVVLVNGSLDLENVYSILADEERGVEQCVQLLASKGKRRLAFAQDADTPANRNKLRGFSTGMLRLGVPPDGQLVYPLCGEDRPQAGPEYTIERGRAVTERILDEHPETDGILYAVDLLAIGGLQVLQKRGLAVPERVSIIGVDNTLYGKICTPQLTTLDNRLVEVSRNASSVLLRALAGEECSRKLQLFTEIVERGTT